MIYSSVLQAHSAIHLASDAKVRLSPSKEHRWIEVEIFTPKGEKCFDLTLYCSSEEQKRDVLRALQAAPAPALHGPFPTEKDVYDLINSYYEAPFDNMSSVESHTALAREILALFNVPSENKSATTTSTP